ncbi:LLM class flavin-dependent oxidoreductase [Leptotrichia sp. OH3620_COT-345]|uniref:LLM class flavin-dependent oxidoreductase n=1 Tax=Leptotrichia sp. OH3620_COT-345 TaxID=2491048 RepID=UPI000F6497CE|nr:LLM class flavin-dependent oxidoreductase [Leptotrichia sp. OH3620_COT-345]RRD38464.1 LLM class flavin-dependent oxidoreductase [Leptotrichia sp. OH3620_COT-345]
MVELGISSFGETTPMEKTGEVLSHDERIRNMVEEIELADKVGLDIYAIGEHHRSDFAVSAPEIVLAAGAVNTKNIRLSSATTNISSNDPVRVYQNFSTVDALSNGRAEIMLGRGSFTESFPLFGYDLKDYEELFNEKMDMILEIKKNEILNWKSRKFTQNVDGKGVYPRAVQEDFPIWVATGGHIESTLRIAEKGLPIVYAIIGGNPLAFKQLIDIYRKFGEESGHNPEKLKVAAHSWGFIADTTEEAVKKYFYPTKVLTDQISRERAHWRELSRDRYMQSVGPNGAMFVGSPDDVAQKLIKVIEDLGLDRFMLHVPIGSIPHEDTMKSIELFGTKVAPIVREYFGKKAK